MPRCAASRSASRYIFKIERRNQRIADHDIIKRGARRVFIHHPVMPEVANGQKSI